MKLQLAERGYKLTGPRKQIAATLAEASRPLTAAEVAARAGTSVASTYRVLALFVQLGLASEIPDEACAEADNSEDSRCHRYALCSNSGHHHHFVCRACRNFIDIQTDSVERALGDLERMTGLHIESHELTLHGVCLSCQEGVRQ